MPNHDEADLSATPSILDQIQSYQSKLSTVRDALETVYFGDFCTIESLLISLFARGHVLLLGAPGVAKTMLAKSFSEILRCSFKRIQFTPDLLPSDITGVYIPNSTTGEFFLYKGPIFANIVLADEINRAPAKTQSALLEAMQEGQVTIEGNTHPLEQPFIVMATRNPIEQRGVYQLPEAQLDRFLLQVNLGYPTFEQEFRILRTHQLRRKPLEPLLSSNDVLQLQALTEKIHISDELLRYIAKILRATRSSDMISLGASPRAGIALVRAAKARAILFGRDFVLPEDIISLIERVICHRLILSVDADYNDRSAHEIMKDLVRRIPFSEN